MQIAALPTDVLSKINNIVNYIHLHIYHTYVNKSLWKQYETVLFKLINALNTNC